MAKLLTIGIKSGGFTGYQKYSVYKVFQLNLCEKKTLIY